jgi:hypothetical protein
MLCTVNGLFGLVCSSDLKFSGDPKIGQLHFKPHLLANLSGFGLAEEVRLLQLSIGSLQKVWAVLNR